MQADLPEFCGRGHALTPDNVHWTNRVKGGPKRWACNACKRTDKFNKNLRDAVMLPPGTQYVLGVYKEPLRKVENGFGFYGTVAHDKSKEYTQCHICGYFWRNLGAHAARVHGVKTQEYKERFGLRLGRSLAAPVMRGKYLVSSWEALSEDMRRQRLNNLKKGREAPNAHRHQSWITKSLEQKNEEGSCPDQLLDKIKKLAEKLGSTPTSEEFRREYQGFLKPVYTTFGSWSNALKILELSPSPIGVPPRYTEDGLIKMLRDFEKYYNRKPYYADCGPLLPSGFTFTKYFGSWSKAKEAAFGKDTK